MDIPEIDMAELVYQFISEHEYIVLEKEINRTVGFVRFAEPEKMWKFHYQYDDEIEEAERMAFHSLQALKHVIFGTWLEAKLARAGKLLS